MKPPAFIYLFYTLTFVGAAALYIVLSGNDVVGNSPRVLYFINVLSIGLTFAGFYAGMSLEKWGWLRRRLEISESATAERSRRLLSLFKIAIFCFLLFYNTALYSVAAYAQETLKYCVLVSIVLGILVFPKS